MENINCFGSPPMAASLIVELWKKHNSFIIKIKYNGKYVNI
jgi:hypothetical protein